MHVLIYVGGVLTGAGLLIANQWYASRAASTARTQAYKDYRTREHERNAAYDSGYNDGRRDYRSRTDAERFAETWEGRRVQFRAK